MLTGRQAVKPLCFFLIGQLKMQSEQNCVIEEDALFFSCISLKMMNPVPSKCFHG